MPDDPIGRAGERLADLSAVVTGAARGVGAAIARRLAAEGAGVVCVDLDGAAVADLAESISAGGARAVAVSADIGSGTGNSEAIEAAVGEFGGLDAFVANAAQQFTGELAEMDESAWDAMQRTNLLGAMLGAREALPALRRRGGGSLVLVSSVLGFVGDPSLVAYGTTKGGLRSMCRALAAAHGHENIRCNTVCPGDVETAMVADYLAAQSDPEAARAEAIRSYPLGRFAAPEDVASAVAFLVSADASYISGTDLVLDGGLLARVY